MRVALRFGRHGHSPKHFEQRLVFRIVHQGLSPRLLLSGAGLQPASFAFRFRHRVFEDTHTDFAQTQGLFLIEAVVVE
ncbi:hypothetical protein D3C76_1472270 [compost metagenome]